ncbi:MAG: YciI family protein [Pseudonocardia sp.]|nr:YciI family protein [Pseudonocardia sp.]
MFLRDPAFEVLPADEREAVSQQADALFDEITASGELIVGTALADPVHTVRLAGVGRAAGGGPGRVGPVGDGRADGGGPGRVGAVTDGPFAEAKEQLAGYFVLDCDSPDRAREIASRFPDVRFGAVEVRPIMGSSGQEM